MNLLTVKEVAAMMRVSAAQVYAMANKIGHIRIGTSIRFRTVDVEAFLDANTREPEQPRQRVSRPKLTHLRYL